MNSLKSTESNNFFWKVKFNTIINTEDVLTINKYKVTVAFDSGIDDPKYYDIAFQKMEMLFKVMLDDSIITYYEHAEDLSNIYQNQIIATPEKPSDVCIGQLIYSKLSAITEGSFIIDHITISSNLGRNIKIIIDQDSLDVVNSVSKKDWWGRLDIDEKFWWNRNDTTTCDIVLEDGTVDKGKITWEEIFKEELENIKSESDKKSKFVVIPGGKDGN